MTIRVSKALLLFALGFYYTLVVFNNTNDYNSNLTFVRHVLLMDTTYPGNHGMWRAIHAPAVPLMFFVSIVCWEIVTGVLCWWAGFRLIRNLRSSASGLQCCQEAGSGGPDAELADVADSFFECRQRVVFDVAVQGMERRVRSPTICSPSRVLSCSTWSCLIWRVRRRKNPQVHYAALLKKHFQERSGRTAGPSTTLRFGPTARRDRRDDNSSESGSIGGWWKELQIPPRHAGTGRLRSG